MSAYDAGYGIIQGIMGAFAGAGQGIADQALLEQKTQIEALRDQRLADLARQTHAADTASDIAAKDAEATQNAQRTAAFFSNPANQAPSTPISNTASATYTDESGEPLSVDSNTTTATEQPSARANAAALAANSLTTGRPEIISAAENYQKNVLAAEDMDRKNALEQGRLAVDASRTPYYVALANKYQAETDVLSQGGKTIPAPMIQSKQDDDGHNYLLDTHSGAIGKIVPGQAAQKGETHWIGPDTPEKPAVPMHVEWTTSDGTPITGGIDSLYPAWAASRSKQIGRKADGGIIDTARASSGPPEDDGSGITAQIAAVANADSGAAPAASTTPAPTQATTLAPPKVGDVVKDFRFTGGNPNNKANWKKVQ